MRKFFKKFSLRDFSGGGSLVQDSRFVVGSRIVFYVCVKVRVFISYLGDG